ncbi:MAG TPA: winged helix-turn-helix transcriptional regulator [Candidatus Thermoplasmatota archaeon]|nr:winged helix-turn-helix transcriptional regulator [Candidatus Thermoplasmatota archaeon]
MRRALVAGILALTAGLTAAVSAEGGTIKEEAGPASVKVVSDGHPVNLHYDSGGTQTDPGDDEIDVRQHVHLVQIKVKHQGLPEIGWSANLRDMWVEHPVWQFANEMFSSTYQAHAPAYARETFDVEFRDWSFKIHLNIQTPVYKDNRCEGRCELPYFGRYDGVRLPAALTLNGTDFLIWFAAEEFRRCHPDPPIIVTICPPPGFDFPEQALYDATPNVTSGYYVAEVDAKIQPGPPLNQLATHAADQLGGRIADSSEAPSNFGTTELDRGLPLSSLPPALLQAPQPLQFAASGDQRAAGIPPGSQASIPQALEAILLLLAILVVPFAILYHRLKPDRILYHPLRRRIYNAVVSSPGIHLGALAADLDVPYQTVEYHATRLEEAHILASRVFGNKRCFFLNGGRFTALEQHVNALLQRQQPRRILETLAATERLTQRDIAQNLGVHDSTIHWHLKHMRSLDLIKVLPGRPKVLSLDDTVRSVVQKSLDETRAAGRP